MPPQFFGCRRTDGNMQRFKIALETKRMRKKAANELK